MGRAVHRARGVCVWSVGREEGKSSPALDEEGAGKPRRRSPRQLGCMDWALVWRSNYPSLTVQWHPSACAGIHVSIARGCCYLQMHASLHPALTQPGQR